MHYIGPVFGVAMGVLLLAAPAAGQAPASREGKHGNPEEFLKQPVYSREYPPCRYC